MANDPKNENAPKVTVHESPTPNAINDKRVGKQQDAKDPETVPYVELVKQVVQVPNTQPAQTGRTRETAEEQILRVDSGPNSVEATSGLDRDPQHAAIVHTGHGVDRIETEAEKVARTGNAGVNIGRPTPADPEAKGSARLGAEQEAGRQTLARKQGNFAQEAGAHARNREARKTT